MQTIKDMKTRKQYEEYLNSTSPDSDSQKWVIGGKNSYKFRENYGTMLKRYDPVSFEVGFKEWKDEK